MYIWEYLDDIIIPGFFLCAIVGFDVLKNLE